MSYNNHNYKNSQFQNFRNMPEKCDTSLRGWIQMFSIEHGLGYEMGQPLRDAYMQVHTREPPINMDQMIMTWKDIVHVEMRPCPDNPWERKMIMFPVDSEHLVKAKFQNAGTQLQTGSSYSVCVIHIENCRHIYIQLNNNEVHCLMTSLQLHYSIDDNIKVMTRLDIGSLCAVRTNGRWYRGRLIARINPLTDKGFISKRTPGCKIYLVDFGSTMAFHHRSLFELADIYTAKEPLAYCCSMANLRPLYGYRWSEESTNTLRSLTEGLYMTAFVSDICSSGRYSVQLINPMTRKIVNKKLAAKKLVRYAPSMSDPQIPAVYPRPSRAIALVNESGSDIRPLMSLNLRPTHNRNVTERYTKIVKKHKDDEIRGCFISTIKKKPKIKTTIPEMVYSRSHILDLGHMNYSLPINKIVGNRLKLLDIFDPCVFKKGPELSKNSLKSFISSELVNPGMVFIEVNGVPTYYEYEEGNASQINSPSASPSKTTNVSISHRESPITNPTVATTSTTVDSSPSKKWRGNNAYVRTIRVEGTSRTPALQRERALDFKNLTSRQKRNKDYRELRGSSISTHPENEIDCEASYGYGPKALKIESEPLKPSNQTTDGRVKNDNLNTLKESDNEFWINEFDENMEYINHSSQDVQSTSELNDANDWISEFDENVEFINNPVKHSEQMDEINDPAFNENDWRKEFDENIEYKNESNDSRYIIENEKWIQEFDETKEFLNDSSKYYSSNISESDAYIDNDIMYNNWINEFDENLDFISEILNVRSKPGSDEIKELSNGDGKETGILGEEEICTSDEWIKEFDENLDFYETIDRGNKHLNKGNQGTKLENNHVLGGDNINNIIVPTTKPSESM